MSTCRWQRRKLVNKPLPVTCGGDPSVGTGASISAKAVAVGTAAPVVATSGGVRAAAKKRRDFLVEMASATTIAGLSSEAATPSTGSSSVAAASDGTCAIAAQLPLSSQVPAPASWELDELLCCHVCFFLDPTDWRRLRVASSMLSSRFTMPEMRRLFSLRLRSRIDAIVPMCHESFLPRERELDSLLHVLMLASTVDAMADVLKDACANPRLVDLNTSPVQQVVLQLHALSVRNQEIMVRERSSRRGSFQKRLLRTFGGFSGIMPSIVTLLIAFPPCKMSPLVFTATCEVVASLFHNARDSKRIFIAGGGLTAVLSYLRIKSGDVEVQAAGLAALLGLSAKSVLCIRRMVEANAHKLVAKALERFPDNDKVVARATGLLLNMSNVPHVCPALQRCGALEAVSRLVGQGNSEELRDFVQHLLANVRQIAR